MTPRHGEIWLVDMGMAAKTRPTVVLIADNLDAPRSLIIHIPITRQNRGSELEVALGHLPFLDFASNGIESCQDCPRESLRLVSRLRPVLGGCILLWRRDGAPTSAPARLSGFSASNLWRMRQFHDTYLPQPKLAPLLRELNWT
jgi:hypothetical protein